MFIMKTCLVLSLMEILLINGATSMVHTLMEFRTFSTQVPNFPEYVMVGVLNGLQIYYYDSNTRREVPKQDWMNKVTEEDPQLWERNTQRSSNTEQTSKGNIEIAKQLFNQTEGAHVWQEMIGCEWDDETDEIIKGYQQFAFDGEDFLSLDWKTDTYVAAKQQAFITKQRWDSDGTAVRQKAIITHSCVEDLKKFVRFGESTLKRTELPLVSLLQKSSSAPVTCHATGFYPDRAMMFWTKDGEELYEGVDPGEILPNHDGTFQVSVDLDVSSVPSEDWDRYKCVFQLSGVKEDLLTRLDQHNIRTNDENGPHYISYEKKHTLSIVAAVLAVLGVAVLVAVGVFLYKKAKQPSPPPSEPEVMQELNPTN